MLPTPWPYIRECRQPSYTAAHGTADILRIGKTNLTSLCEWTWMTETGSDTLDSGATFVILSKAKGWYIVQRDPDGFGDIIPDQAKSGWVPAGKLPASSLLTGISILILYRLLAGDLSTDIGGHTICERVSWPFTSSTVRDHVQLVSWCCVDGL